MTGHTQQPLAKSVSYINVAIDDCDIANIGIFFLFREI